MRPCLDVVEEREQENVAKRHLGILNVVEFADLEAGVYTRPLFGST